MSAERKVFCEALGKYISLPSKCERIVSFSPSITEALFEMGLGEKVKGVSVYCVRPEYARKEKIIVGSYSTCKFEKLKEINPDLIFTTTGYQLDFAKKLSEDFPVYAVRLPLTVVDLISTLVEAGIVAGYEREARELEKSLVLELCRHVWDTENKAADIERKNQVETEKNNENQNSKIKVYVEIDLGGPTTFGAWSYITDALCILGFENIFGDEKAEWLKPDDLKVREKNPDVIIYEPKMFSKRRDKNDIFSRLQERFGNVNAIKNKNVFITSGIYDFLAHHGPSFIYEVIPWLKKVKMGIKQG